MENEPDLILPQFTRLPVPLPPMLEALLGRNSSRYFCLYGNDAGYWSTGWESGAFHPLAIFKPLLSHPALALALREFVVCEEAQFPPHVLLADRQTAQWYVGDYAMAQQFLQSRNARPATQPPPAPPPADISGEVFFWGEALDQWLDQFVTTRLLEDYLEASSRTGCPHCFRLVQCVEKWRRQKRKRR